MDAVITSVEKDNQIPVGTTKMMAAIESAEGGIERTGDCQSVRATDRELL